MLSDDAPVDACDIEDHPELRPLLEELIEGGFASRGSFGFSRLPDANGARWEDIDGGVNTPMLERLCAARGWTLEVHEDRWVILPAAS